ncbi:hypothetical protein K3495_g2043 [Podosphaera aphanis]|nr:hypothetical protein K3495_g2043 [Podosphaera aphanis]
MQDGVRHARNELFEDLKPICVGISQLAIRDDGSHHSLKILREPLARLLTILEQKCRRTDGVFDEKLADYVFFPLSQILRAKQKFTDQLAELTIKCIQILIKYGWKSSINLDLGKQLLIWLTFVVGGVPGKKVTSVPEELTIEAYGALAALFESFSNTSGGATTLVESDIIPALGHCITVLLDGVTDGASSDIQSQALSTLHQLWSCLENMETLLKFLPGAVSALAKCLTPTTKVRRSQKTLVKALEVLGYILVSSLNDIRATSIRARSKNLKESPANDLSQLTLTASWLEATSGQVKLILSNVIKLRDHEKLQVCKALNKFCITILDNCHDTLSGSSRILVETCMTLNGIDSEDSPYNWNTTFTDLALIRTDYAELVKDILYDWVSSLPRKMQGNDEQVKISAIKQLSKAQEYFVKLGLESSALDEVLRNSLRDSITVSLESLKPAKVQQESTVDLSCLAVSTSVIQATDSRVFPPIIMYQEADRQTRESYLALIASLPKIDTQVELASEMLEYAKCASGPSFIAAFWLSLQAIKTAWARDQDIEEFSEVYAPSRVQLSVEQDLFSFAHSLLSLTDEGGSDWRPKTIALEVLAETAKRMKHSYRLELVDTLYPVVQLLGSPNPRLREHAITCLNIISFSCGYDSTSDLIIENVDYMVNAISLKLNTFDITPQAPQVLVMMIRLTGPRLLPYLDDILGSIFAALANFHGYQLLVDSFFSVLAEIVSVGSKSDQHHVITGESAQSHAKQRPLAPSIESICTALLPHKSDDLDCDPAPHESFPHAPWKLAETSNDDEDDTEAGIPEEQQEESPATCTEVQQPAPTKIYTILQSITRLCQYHLTSPSPVLRSRLLSLIRDATCVLSPNEDAFLPLVNDLWPVVVKRLYDSEPFVCVAACDTVADLCRCAGDFLTTRFRTEWPDLLSLARRTCKTAELEKQRGGARGKFSQSSRLWEALVHLLCALVGYVTIQDEMFDDVLEVLTPLIVDRKDIRSVLETINPDAVWSAMYKMGAVTAPSTPVFEGYEFAPLHSRVYKTSISGISLPLRHTYD